MSNYSRFLVACFVMCLIFWHFHLYEQTRGQKMKMPSPEIALRSSFPWLSISLNSPSLNVCFYQISFLSFKKLSSVNNAESSSKNKIIWTKFSHEEIHEKYVNPLLSDLEFFELDFCDSVSVTENLTSLIVHHSYSLRAPKQPKSDITDSNNRKVYARLPDNVKSARIRSKSAFDSWKASSFSLGSVSHDNYRS